MTSYHQRTKKKDRPITNSTIGQKALVSSRDTGDMLYEHKGIHSNWRKARAIPDNVSVKGSQSLH